MESGKNEGMLQGLPFHKGGFELITFDFAKKIGFAIYLCLQKYI